MATFLDTGVRDLTDFVVYESYYTRCGGFSDVYKGALDERPLVRRTWNIMRWLSPGAKRVTVAVKVIRTSQQMDPLETESVKRDLMDEITAWSQLEHFNVLPLLGIVRGVHGRTLPSLVSPWCEHGSIFEYIKRPRPAADCISLILQAASAISYLHSCSEPVIHGDIKSDNFLLRSGYQVQLSDFGLSKIPREGVHSRFSRSTDGNIRWMSPELLSGGTDSIPTPRSFASDIWALACTFFEILTSSMPYQEILHDWDVVDRIRQGLMPTEPANPLSEELAQLQQTVWPILEKSWTRDPMLRPHIGEVLYDLHQAILTREARHFYRPVFEFETGEYRPSVIGNEDQPDETRALALLARSAIGYHCKSDENRAYDLQARIGWIHISCEQFPEAQAHLEVAKGFFEARHDYYSVLACQRGLAEATQDLAERIKQYTPALALCSARMWVDQEAFIVRELGNTILAQSELAESGEKQALISRARLYLTEALSLYAGQTNLKLQAQVRCELLLLEREAKNDSAAQTHASAAFQCARETRDRNFTEEVCDYLKSTNALSEAMYNAIDFGLRKMTLDTLDRMLQTRIDLPRADSQLDVYFI